ncbi:class I SAM-dependent methyltransferase [Streptomyces malaysiensis]|uniref:Methyltransferase n=1 Tax=Streptomyces malaysiensis TaxID=92644 RepID=A0A7X6B100_STRMQ|nr:class I SAM-dependent methyltransferase [Streptomyces malaysiensis]NIY69350.1 Methyltransferase [Streptomyces malaysiensis]
MSEQFTTLGQAYEETHTMPFRHYMETPSVLERLGDLRGLSVLDIGCGSGAYTRLLKRSGADRVVGLDASEGMLEMARWREAHEKLGVEYVCRDVADTGPLGPFDLVVGVYVLPYAESIERLYAMCRGVASVLTARGRFVTLPLNPELSLDPSWYTPYGFTMRSEVPRGDGTPAVLTVDFAETRFSVSSQQWSRDTYEQALSEAGFAATQWDELRPSAQGVAEHGRDFWQRYVICPHALILDCRKQPPTAAPQVHP